MSAAAGQDKESERKESVGDVIHWDKHIWFPGNGRIKEQKALEVINRNHSMGVVVIGGRNV